MEVEEIRFEYAWRWFDFHAKQRMQLFNFFLIITGILANAYVAAYSSHLHFMTIAVSLLGVLQACGFFVFDLRSRQLTRFSEDVLEKLERDWIFPESFAESHLNRGQRLSILLRDSEQNMREGSDRPRGLGGLLKMKIWIRTIELFVGLAFLAALVIGVLKSLA
jgi:hypothetical protein